MPAKGHTPGLHRFAEAMAEHGGTVEQVAQITGISKDAARRHFRRMKRELGWQAR